MRCTDSGARDQNNAHAENQCCDQIVASPEALKTPPGDFAQEKKTILKHVYSNCHDVTFARSLNMCTCRNVGLV